jgi:hypothetical protein
MSRQTIRTRVTVLLAGGLLAGCAAAVAPASSHLSTGAAPGSASPSRPAIAAAPGLTPGTRPAPASPFVPLSFTAVSLTHWWVLGTVPCGHRDCLSIRTTTDGGATFRVLPAPGSSFGPGLNAPPPAAQIRFANPSDGWVFGPSLYYTRDAGQHWTTVPVHGAVFDLEPGLGQVYAVISPPAPPCERSGTCGPGTAAPRLWRALPSAGQWTIDQASGAVSGSLAVHGMSVWLVNSLSTGDGPALGSGLLYSADGGQSFALEPAQIPGIACAYSPVSDTFLWSYCSGGHFEFVFASGDAGTRFTAIPGSGRQPNPNGFPNGASLAGASATVAVAASSMPDSPIVRTSDAGTTWRVVQAAPDAAGTWSLIGFTTPEVGYALWSHDAATFTSGTAQLWRTADGGIRWSRVTTLP